MWVFNAETRRFLEANQAAADLYGYSVEEFRSMTLNDLQPADEVQRFLAQLQNSSKTVPATWRHRTKSGRAVDVELAVHDIQYGGKNVQLAVLMDVTRPSRIGRATPAGAKNGSCRHVGRRRGARFQ